MELQLCWYRVGFFVFINAFIICSLLVSILLCKWYFKWDSATVFSFIFLGHRISFLCTLKSDHHQHKNIELTDTQFCVTYLIFLLTKFSFSWILLLSPFQNLFWRCFSSTSMQIGRYISAQVRSATGILWWFTMLRHLIISETNPECVSLMMCGY